MSFEKTDLIFEGNWIAGPGIFCLSFHLLGVSGDIKVALSPSRLLRIIPFQKWSIKGLIHSDHPRSHFMAVSWLRFQIESRENTKMTQNHQSSRLWCGPPQIPARPHARKIEYIGKSAEKESYSHFQVRISFKFFQCRTREGSWLIPAMLSGKVINWAVWWMNTCLWIMGILQQWSSQIYGALPGDEGF